MLVSSSTMRTSAQLHGRESLSRIEDAMLAAVASDIQGQGLAYSGTAPKWSEPSAAASGGAPQGVQAGACLHSAIGLESAPLSRWMSAWRLWLSKINR